MTAAPSPYLQVWFCGYQDRGNIAYTKPPRPYDNFSGGSSGGTRPLFLDQTGAQRPGPGLGSPLSQGLDDRSLFPLSAGLVLAVFTLYGQVI